MAGSKFQYDENGGTFFYFLLSFEALVVVPCTYYFYPRNGGKVEEKRDKTHCHCDNCQIKNCRLRLKEPWRKAKERFIKFLLLIGWITLFATAYKVSYLQHDYVAYDPFAVLQIDAGASMAEIKKAYRRLSLVFHPDKESGDEKKFMMIAKAYAALTDDEARKNWEMYGNPDGPGATSFGIALPSWIVEKENSVWVLGLYALVFMVALPVAVGIWWHRSVKYGGDQVLLDTTQLYMYFIHKNPHMILRRVLMILACSLEFEKRYNSEIIERPSDNIEVSQLIKELPNLNEKNRERPLCFGYSIKARALLHAHLSRMKLPPNTLEEDKLCVVKKCPYLLNDFIQSAAQMTLLALAGKVARTPNLDTIENAMKLSALIVQALWDTKSLLLQLPHVTEDMLRHFTTRKRNIRNIHNLASMKSDDRRAMLRTLNDDQYDDLINVLAKMPLIDIAVKSEVLDDEDSGTITAGAIVTVTATLTRKNMSTLFDQELPHDNNHVEDVPEETEQPLVNGDISPKAKKSKAWEKKKKKGKGGGKSTKKKSAFRGGKPAPPPVQNNKRASEERNGLAVQPQVNNEPSNESGSESDSEVEQAANSSHSGSEDEHSSEDKNDDAEWEKVQKKVAKKENVLEAKSKKSHSVHCPFFPEDKQEYWWVYLADKKKHALITVPFLVTNLVEKEEVELKFTAPPKPGIHSYALIVRSDSYCDFDVVKMIKLDVKEAKEVDLTKVQWDVSEEEDEKEEEESAVEDSDLATDDETDDE